MSAGEQDVSERSAQQLEEVVDAIDAGEITATSAERAHLVATAQVLRRDEVVAHPR